MASRGVNKAIIVGNLGNDPDSRFMPNGNAVANLSVATSETWTDKNTGQLQERTEWHRIVAYGKLAEIMGQYLRKGSKVYIEGRIQTRKWQDQTGQDRYTTEIVANEMQMLDSRQGGAADFGQGAPQQAYPQQGSGQQSAPAPQQPQQNAPQSTQFSQPFEAPKIDNNDDFSDDIPF